MEIFRANGSHVKMLSDEAENREYPEAFFDAYATGGGEERNWWR